MQRRAYAKINLGLRVLHKRADGFHEIETIFQQISLCDTLKFENNRGEIILHCQPPTLPMDERNLAFRAAQLLQQRTKTSSGCRIYLDKKIPIGAGLGGGSSDAAATLQSLNKLWGLKLTTGDLLELAAELGSDVPFFLYGGSALGRGRGEILQPLKIPTCYWGVLVYPQLSISTRWVYENGNFNLTKTLKNSKFYSLSNFAHSLTEWQKYLQNDLQAIVFTKYPFLQSIIEQLQKEGAFFASMSGSGSSVFGLFFEKHQALAALKHVNQEYTRFLFRPLRGASRSITMLSDGF